MKKIYLIQLTILYICFSVCLSQCDTFYTNYDDIYSHCEICSDSSCQTCADGYFSSSVNDSIQDGCVTDINNVIHFEYDGHTYEIVKEISTKADATTCANTKGGYLAIFETEEEHNAIQDVLYDGVFNVDESKAGTDAYHVYIGGSDSGLDGTWQWQETTSNFWVGFTDGTLQPNSFAQWGTNDEGVRQYPQSSATDNELAIVIGTIAGIVEQFFWVNTAGTNELYYIIEYDGVRCQQCHSNCNTCGSGPTDCASDCNVGFEGVDCSQTINCSANTQNCQFCTDTNDCGVCNPGFAKPDENTHTCTETVDCSEELPQCTLCISTTECVTNSCTIGYIGDCTEKIDCSAAIGNGNCDLCTDTDNCDTCLTGWEGIDCSQKITCFDQCNTCEDDSTCHSCNTGYDGDECEYKIECDEYVPNCDLCLNLISCNTCQVGWEDGLCSTKISCQSTIPNCNLCVNTTTCSSCNSGYQGDGCDELVQCPNIERCTLCTDASTCFQCETGYTGDTCEEQIDCSGTVQNCALCTSTTQCSECATGYQGDECDEKIVCIDNCDICVNETTCQTCVAAFTGDNCDQKSCTVENCVTCQDATNCSECNVGYSGVDCQKDDDGSQNIQQETSTGSNVLNFCFYTTLILIYLFI